MSTVLTLIVDIQWSDGSKFNESGGESMTDLSSINLWTKAFSQQWSRKNQFVRLKEKSKLALEQSQREQGHQSHTYKGSNTAAEGVLLIHSADTVSETNLVKQTGSSLLHSARVTPVSGTDGHALNNRTQFFRILSVELHNLLRRQQQRRKHLQAK